MRERLLSPRFDHQPEEEYLRWTALAYRCLLEPRIFARFRSTPALADEGGFHSVWSYELFKNPFAMLCTAALETTRSTLGTGLAAAFSRSPFEAANAAADVDELSDGRMLLGLGTGLPDAQHGYHSVAPGPLGRTHA